MRRPVTLCTLVAAALALAYVAIAPPSADLAAAAFRADLFSRVGPALVSTAWYGGHHLPAYSVLYPPAGALLGPRLTAAIAATVAAGLFAALAGRAFRPPAALAGGLWFAAGIGINLLTGRVPFLMGVALGLGALLAAQRRQPLAAGALGVLTPLASPVAGAFLALIGVSWTFATGRRVGLVLAVVGLVPTAILAALFPEGGTEPFAPSAALPAFGALAGLALLLPRDQRVLRTGAALYAVVVLGCFAIPTPLGGNVTRMAALAAGPLVACALWSRRPALLAALVLPLAYWQLMPPVRDVAAVAGDPSTRASYYAPLLRELRSEPGPFRVEVPFTRAHWEAYRLARHVPLARGWERQVDRERNPLFYDGTLDRARYLTWLRANAVDYVALPDVALDDSAVAEAALVRAGLPGLRLVWSNPHWRLYHVTGAAPIGATRLLPSGFEVARSGVVRVRFAPELAVVQGAGCVSRTANGWTRVQLLGPGPVQVGAVLDLWRSLSDEGSPRCSGP